MREDEGVKLMGDGKHQVEIGHRQEFGFTVFHPLDLGKGLALWAVPIATGIIRVALEATGGTVFRVPTELRCPADLNSVLPVMAQISSTMISLLVKMHISLAIFNDASAICLAESLVWLIRARAADRAKTPPDPMARMPSSGSITSPVPESR